MNRKIMRNRWSIGEGWNLEDGVERRREGQGIGGTVREKGVEHATG